MISAGKNVKSTTDPLVKMPVKHLYHALCNPRQETTLLLGQLRTARAIDPKAYTLLKSQLPFFVCAMFNPPQRRTDYFAYTEYFIIDIDHISEKDLVLDTLRQQINADPRTLLSFVSPGGDGLKVMFRLSERCYDAGLYKVFYKLFLARFSRQYELQQVVDARTCDVARACFLSCDPMAYYNPEAEPVQMQDFIDPETDVQQAFDLKRAADEETRKAEKAEKEDHPTEPPTDILQQIRERLGQQSRPARTERPVYVPDVLNEIIDELRAFIESFQISVTEIRNIQYGKKIRMAVGLKQAEINLFFGKRGFTVVQSPRSGTDTALNETAAMVIQQFIDQK